GVARDISCDDFGSSSSAASSSSALGGSVSTEATAFASSGLQLAAPTASPSSSGVVQEQLCSVLDAFDLWEPILSFAVDWPRSYGRLSSVCRKWQKLCSNPVVC
ncbi:unnamed protein product, partial [Amoebophrya sp. A25]